MTVITLHWYSVKIKNSKLNIISSINIHRFLFIFFKASFVGYNDIVDELINAHADVNLQDNVGFTAIMYGMV